MRGQQNIQFLTIPGILILVIIHKDGVIMTVFYILCSFLHLMFFNMSWHVHLHLEVMPVKFKTLLYDPRAVNYSNIYVKSWYQQVHISTLQLFHIHKGLLHVSANHVATRLAENAVLGVKRLLFLYRQRISAACNSVSIEIKVCCEAQQINRIKIIGNVDGAERSRNDRNTRGTVMLIRKTGQ